MKPKVLIAEISGKRPGDKYKRPTEKFKYDFDKVIISNNSEGYETDWPIVNVPGDYENWYKEHCKMSDLAYFAPMNRSYAIKYAREHGYNYLVQLDDNITTFDIKYRVKRDDGAIISYSTIAKTPHKDELQNDMFRYMVEVLQQTNVGMVGISPASASVPQDDWLNERYVYSAFMLDLSRVPKYFQGDFEDDIEYRLKLRQIKVPSLSVDVFYYGKTAQDKGNGKEDASGNRSAYIKAGLKRGEHMSKLYGDMYERGYSDRGSGIRRTGKVKFRHKVKAFKVGVRVKNIQRLKDKMAAMFAKYATEKPDKIDVNVTKPKIYIGVTDKTKDEFSTLDKLVSVVLKYDLTIVNPQSDDITYAIMSESQSAIESAKLELDTIEGLTVKEGVK